jgi:two-component system chemotaxis sensor kinase CheA
MSEIFDDDELMEAFYEESQNLIDKMRKDLAALSERRDSNILQNLFRHAHIIKSSSGAVGFDDLKKVAQALEKIFKAGSDDKSVITADFIPLLSESVEACQKLLNKEKVVGYKKLLERLNSIIDP